MGEFVTVFSQPDWAKERVLLVDKAFACQIGMNVETSTTNNIINKF